MECVRGKVKHSMVSFPDYQLANVNTTIYFKGTDNDSRHLEMGFSVKEGC